MKQCETCEFKDVKDKLTVCAFAQEKHALTEFAKTFPIIGKYVKDFVCLHYLEAYRADDGP